MGHDGPKSLPELQSHDARKGGRGEAKVHRPISTAPPPHPVVSKLKCTGAQPSRRHRAPDWVRLSQELSDNEMRKSMSLPLLLGNKDRHKLWRERPWRRGEGAQQARFAPVDALAGKAPGPPKRFVTPPHMLYADETMKRLTEEGGVVPEWGEDLDGLLEREDARMRKLTHPTRRGARGKDSDPNSNREGNWDRTTMMSGGHAPRSTNPSRPTLRP